MGKGGGGPGWVGEGGRGGLCRGGGSMVGLSHSYGSERVMCMGGCYSICQQPMGTLPRVPTPILLSPSHATAPALDVPPPHML